MKIVSLADLTEEGVSHNPEIRKRVMLRLGDVPQLTNFTQSRLAPGQVASAHQHADMFEVFFVQAGEGVMRVDDVEQRLEAGVCVMVEPGEAHEIACTGAGELVLLYFGVEV
ncbi:MAG: cupin domain-containing protein [Pyrinomonadaceae bacterium]